MTVMTMVPRAMPLCEAADPDVPAAVVGALMLDDLVNRATLALERKGLAEGTIPEIKPAWLATRTAMMIRKAMR